MELDEVCELVTDARYAYGKAGKYVTLHLEKLYHAWFRRDTYSFVKTIEY